MATLTAEERVQRWIDRVASERARTAPPHDFPVLPDLPAGRYTDPAFFDLEIEYLWRKSWLCAAISTSFPSPGASLSGSTAARQSS